MSNSTIEDYKKVATSNTGGGVTSIDAKKSSTLPPPPSENPILGATTPTNTPTGSSNTANSTDATDYYQMSKNQEYVALLDKEIELENARSNALRLTNNQLAAQGMASQGYGSSSMSGISSQYLNAYENANRDYQGNIADLNYQQHQEELANSNDRFESITTMLSQASSLDEMNSLLADYSYGTVDADGNFQFATQKPEGMSDDDWYQLKYYYNIQKSAIDESNSNYAPTYTDIDSWKKATFTQENGRVRSIEADFKDESNVLWTNINSGKYAYGTSISIKNSDGDVIYVQWTKEGLKMTTKEAYESSKNKKYINYNGSYWAYGEKHSNIDYD